jgi:hypothetical protein
MSGLDKEEVLGGVTAGLGPDPVGADASAAAAPSFVLRMLVKSISDDVEM